MNDLLSEMQGSVFVITLNRVEKHNAFDNTLLQNLQLTFDKAISNPNVRVILLKANGKHFSAGADLAWMQSMVHFSEAENINDALILGRLMNTLYQCPKPTIAAVQGAAFGGGAGLVAACDIAIAATSARFCFSEVKLGLIPAVISPFVVKAIGERAAKWLFMSAESFDAAKALELQLIQFCVSEQELEHFSSNYAQKITQLAPLAVLESKALVKKVGTRAIDNDLMQETAKLIAKKRISPEGQQGLSAFLNKKTPNWS